MISAALVLIAFDLALTLWAVRRWGSSVEFNPIWRGLMDRGGVALFIPAFLTFWVLLLAMASIYELVFIIVGGLVADTAMNLCAVRSNLRKAH